VAHSTCRLKTVMTLAMAGLAGTLAVPQTAEATFGYYGYGYGTQSKGMGGAGTALALDPLAGLTNPASLVHLGNVWAGGLTLFNPNRSYTADDNAQPGFPFASTPGATRAAPNGSSFRTSPATGCWTRTAPLPFHSQGTAA
jgi:long-chain fatty acid transport protein